MDKKLLSRYAKTDDDKLIIDISVSKHLELFDEWDNTASYIKKDIDSDLADYLYDCFDEAKKHEFLIRITIPKKDSKKEEKVVKSIKIYFDYMAEKQKQILRRNVKSTLIHFVIGLLFIMFSVLMRKENETPELLNEVFIEGLIIIGWVTLWQVTTNIISAWHQIFNDYKIYTNIANTPVIFQHQPL
jgi:hypothetical protein